MALFDFLKKKKDPKNTTIPQESSGNTPAPDPVPKKDEEAKAAAERKLKRLIETYHADKSRESLAAILEYLRQDVSVWIPTLVSISPKDEEMFKAAKAGDTVTTQDNIRMRIDILKNSEGQRFFPGFSSIQEAPEQYRGQFSWVSMSFKSCVESVMKSNDIHAIVLNAFSENLVLTRDILALIFPRGVQDYTLEKGTPVILEPVGSDGDEVKRIGLMFLEKNDCSRAYLVKMTARGQESYLFAIEQNRFPDQQYFANMNSKISHINPKLPVDYAPYESFRRQLREQHCQMCYLGKPAATDVLTLAGDPNIRFTLFRDADDQIGKYRMEFLDTGTRYEAYADEMWKISSVLPLPGTMAPVLTALHDARMALPEEEKAGFESRFVSWLDQSGVHYVKSNIRTTAAGRITVLTGSMEGRELSIIHGTEITLGRDPAKCQLVLTPNYPSVSRVHCRILYDGMENQFYVTDLSSQGTSICQSETEILPLPPGKTSPVEPGSVLKLANCYIRLEHT